MGAFNMGSERPKKCIPFVSEYTDCTEENKCTGCSKCTCTAKGEWSCEDVDRCVDILSKSPVDENDIDTALLLMENEIKADQKKKAALSSSPLVPPPPNKDLILDQEDEKKINIEDEILELMRSKRSVDESHNANVGHNDTVKFYHTVDEVNEDSLKNENISGTLQAQKMDIVNHPKLSRRMGLLTDNNTSNSLQIEYNKPQIYHHITDNKIDTIVHSEDKMDESIHEIISNYSQKGKDRKLSQLIVNELKNGTEIIGDRNAPVMSNITFTPENDTLTAMTFIAGNLLNKLWNMEKDSSDESIETEVMKHEKIADLLELFKEPLTIRQEMFLKNALEQLSRAVDNNKDVTNVSLCDNVEESKKILKGTSNSGEDNNETRGRKKCDKDTKQKSVATERVTKLNNVLSLIEKFEGIQSHLNNIKNIQKHNIVDKSKQFNKDYSGSKTFTKEQNTSLDLFGGILEKITKLLMPNKNNKQIINKIKNQNVFGNSRATLKKFNSLFNMDLGNVTTTTKDKIVLDYLSHIIDNPGCLLNKKNGNTEKKTLPIIEGDILLNLSEFFKMKSLTDFMRLLEPVKKTVLKRKPSFSETEDKNTNLFTTPIEATTTATSMDDGSQKLLSIKEKLKTHLKTIVEDLIDIQNAKGIPMKDKGIIQITDVLPCIYNILNADKEISSKKDDKSDILGKIATVFGNLKKDLKYTVQTRRTNIATERPKSAVVWERVIKNLKGKQNLITRRNLNAKIPKSLEELKKTIEVIESGSNTYKNVAFLAEVPPSERLLLLKTLDVDGKKYMDVLENIETSLSYGKIPLNNHKDFTEFVDNVATNINLNDKVIKNLNRPKFRRLFVDTVGSGKDKLNINKPKIKQALRLPAVMPPYNSVKLTRDQIINQLIKNRIKLYIRVKEAKEEDLNEDINYEIAKNILLHLESGNHNLARELYKVFASHNQTNLNYNRDRIESSTSNMISNLRRQQTIEEKEPMVQFEESKVNNDMQMMTQDHLLKQLINIKNMRV